MHNSVSSFSQDYREARGKFLAEAAEAGAAIESIRHPETGPDGAPLHVDVARLGRPDAPKALVLISGTHGVEGFCGSGAQIDLLRRREFATLAEDVSVLFIHAINCWGFAWLRRATHENVDLNRNWIDFARPVPVNADYRVLHEALCPARWTEETRDRGRAELARYARDHGPVAAKNALGAGQYEFADGLYFGGRAPAWSRETQADILRRYLRPSRAIAIIDYHTGLGEWGAVEQIVSVPGSSPVFQRARTWYGAAIRSTSDGSSLGARIAGDGLSAAIDLLPHAEVTPVFVEVGTRSRDFIVSALRADNWLHAHADPAGPDAVAIKAGIRDSYYGDTDDWKAMVAGVSLLMVRQALAGLASSPA